jgi:hypothetical protein
MIPDLVLTGFMVADPLPGHTVLLLLVVPAPDTHNSSPLVFTTLQLSGRFIVILTVYGAVPPLGVAVIVEV